MISERTNVTVWNLLLMLGLLLIVAIPARADGREEQRWHGGHRHESDRHESDRHESDRREGDRHVARQGGREQHDRPVWHQAETSREGRHGLPVQPLPIFRPLNPPHVDFHDGRWHEGRHEVHHGGMHYVFARGTWYRQHHDRWLVVAAPIGVVIPFLPPFATFTWIGGAPYYYANNVFYSRCAEGYTVVQAPQVQTQIPVSTVTAQAPPEVVELGQAPTMTLTQAPEPQLFVYPRLGQSADQQDRDRAECGEWAAAQTGVTSLQDSNTLRAMSACMDGRGYTIK